MSTKAIEVYSIGICYAAKKGRENEMTHLNLIRIIMNALSKKLDISKQEADRERGSADQC